MLYAPAATGPNLRGDYSAVAADFTVDQDWGAYAAGEHALWRRLYDRQAGLGTLVATMLPYSVVFLVGWTLFFAAWLAFGLPLGFGGG